MASSAHQNGLKTFDDLASTGFFRDEIGFRLIHFWKSRKFTQGNLLMGLELLLVDAKATAVQAFIPVRAMSRYEPKLKGNTVYKISKVSVIPAKELYKITDHKYKISFTDQTALDEIISPEVHHFPSQHFRLRNYPDFASIADKYIAFYDVIGQIRVVDGENNHHQGAQELNEDNLKARLNVHIEMKDGITVRLKLWDGVAVEFQKRFNANDVQPTVLLLTAVNPKTFHGKRFNANEEGKSSSTIVCSSSEVTKIETLTLREIYEFINTGSGKEAWFMCTVKIVEFLSQYGWHFIACGKCKTKLKTSDTSLLCSNPKCQKPNTVGLIRYRFEVTVRDKDDEATFVIFDREGEQLLGRTAAEIMNDLPENDDDVQCTPPGLLDVIGRTCKFKVKISEYNYRASRQTITVTQIIDDNIEALSQPELVQDAIGEGDKSIGNVGTTTKQEGKRHVETAKNESTAPTKKKDKRPRHT